MAGDIGPLGRYLPYLLNRAGARLAVSFSAEIRPLGATLQAWRVLAALRERDGQRMGELAAATSIELSTLSRVVDGMERDGLLARRAGRADARIVKVHVTAAGRRLTRRLLPVAARYEAVALAGFSAGEARMLKAALQRVYDNLAGLQR